MGSREARKKITVDVTARLLPSTGKLGLDHLTLSQKFHRHIPESFLEPCTSFPYTFPFRQSELRRWIGDNECFEVFCDNMGNSAVSIINATTESQEQSAYRGQISQRVDIPHPHTPPSSVYTDFLRSLPNYSRFCSVSLATNQLRRTQANTPRAPSLTSLRRLA